MKPQWGLIINHWNDKCADVDGSTHRIGLGEVSWCGFFFPLSVIMHVMVWQPIKHTADISPLNVNASVEWCLNGFMLESCCLVLLIYSFIYVIIIWFEFFVISWFTQRRWSVYVLAIPYVSSATTASLSRELGVMWEAGGKHYYVEQLIWPVCGHLLF